MTTALEQRPLTSTERAIAVGYARGHDIAVVAAAVSLPQEYVGERLLELCGLNRQQAQEIVRRGRTLPVHIEPPLRRAAPRYVAVKPDAVVDGPEQEWPLVDRELQLLKLLATGLTVAAIADQQGYKLLTVQTNISRLYRRLGVGGKSARAAAIAAGVRRGNLTAAEAAVGEAEVKRAASQKARHAALVKAGKRPVADDRGQLLDAVLVERFGPEARRAG